MRHPVCGLSGGSSNPLFLRDSEGNPKRQQPASMSFTVASMKSLQLKSQVTYYSGVWILIRGEPLESYSSDWSDILSGASKAITGIGKRTVAVTEKQRDFVLLYIQCKVGSQIKHQSLERTLTNSFRKCKAVIGNFDGVSPFVDLEVVFGEVEARARGPKPKALSEFQLHEADAAGLTHSQLCKVVEALREELQRPIDGPISDPVDICIDNDDLESSNSNDLGSSKRAVAEYMYRLLLLTDDKAKEFEASITIPEGVCDPEEYRSRTLNEQMTAWSQSNVTRGELRDKFMTATSDQIRQEYLETRPGFEWPDFDWTKVDTSDNEHIEFLVNEHRNKCVAEFEQIPLPVRDAMEDMLEHVSSQQQKAQEAEDQRERKRQADRSAESFARAFTMRKEARSKEEESKAGRQRD